MSDGTYAMYAWRCDACWEDSGRWSDLDPPVTFKTELEARAAYQQHLVSMSHAVMVEDEIESPD